MDARLLGLDLARFLAIVGMIVAHTVSPEQQGPVVTALVTGNAATLFAVAGGCSIALASRRLLSEGAARSARVALLARGAAVILLGLALAAALQQAVIVLVYFGVAMWLAVPFLTARHGTVIAWAAGLAAVVPVLNWWARGDATWADGTLSVGLGDFGDPARLVRGVLLTGTYPALTWLVYLLVGLLLGRALIAAVQEQRTGRFATRLALGGLTAALGAWTVAALLRLLPIPTTDELPTQFYGGSSGDVATLLAAVPHSGTALDIVRGVGVGGAAIGLCLLLLLRAPRAASALRPTLAAGGASLSVYVLHILTLMGVAIAATLLDPEPAWWVQGWGAAALNLLVVLALGATLAALRRRGPLELVVSRLARTAAARARRLPMVGGTKSAR